MSKRALTISRFIAAIDDDTDFTVSTGDGAYTWRIHAELAAKHSTFFKTMIDGPWTVSSPSLSQNRQPPQPKNISPCTHTATKQESRKKTADLHKDNPWMVARMLQFFYRSTYDYGHEARFSGFGLPASSEASTRLTLTKMMSRVQGDQKPIGDFSLQKTTDCRLSEIEIDAAMYVVADKYGAAHLKMHSLEKLGARHAAYETLIKVCQGDFRDLVDKDNDLKVVIAEKIATHYKDLRERRNEWLQKWIVSDPVFAMLILDSMRGIKLPHTSTMAFRAEVATSSPPQCITPFGPQRNQTNATFGQEFRGLGQATPAFGFGAPPPPSASPFGNRGSG